MGKLLGDSTVRTIESRLRSVLTGGVEGGELSTLSQLGISLQRDGTLEVDDDKLSDLVANNPQALSDFFAGADDAGGLAGKLGASVEQMLGNNYERMEKSIEGTISRYRSQFSQLDVMIAQMNSTSSYLTQQFDALDAQLGRD